MSTYRPSLDPFLLAAFVGRPPCATVADLGTGDGILPCLLARTVGYRSLIAVEVQPALAERAADAFAREGLEERVRLELLDLRAIERHLPPQGVELVVTNPPYRPRGQGRLAPGAERAAARHELHGGLTDFLRAAAWLLGDGGRFCIVYLAERLPELLAEMRARRLEPKRLRCVHGRLDRPARMVLVEGRKGGRPGLEVEPPLIVYAGRGYTAEVRALYREFGYEVGEGDNQDSGLSGNQGSGLSALD